MKSSVRRVEGKWLDPLYVKGDSDKLLYAWQQSV